MFTGGYALRRRRGDGEMAIQPEREEAALVRTLAPVSPPSSAVGLRRALAAPPLRRAQPINRKVTARRLDGVWKQIAAEL